MPIARVWATAAACAGCAVAWLAAAGAGPKLQEDPPLAPAPKAGRLTGAVTPAEKVTDLQAVCRDTGKTHSPATLDRATGEFAFADLPGDAAYDVTFRTPDGRRIEGIDLGFADARMLRLAAMRRKQLGLPEEPAHEFTAEDTKALLDYVRDLCERDFMEQGRVLYLQPHGGRATMLIELLRTREFHQSGGALVWRVELWYFQHRHGGWERLANQEHVLRRERIFPDEWRKISVEYYPDLSGYLRPDGTSQPIRFRIPDKPDPSRGRPADTPADLKTEPHLLGSAASQPATAASRDAGDS